MTTTLNGNKQIIISKEDVIPYIYFVCSKAQRGKMYGGLSGKSDYIGGIFDRWINIIPESVIFNKYLLPKISSKLSVISDYYEYNPKKSGIAPDVLGVKDGSISKPFVEYSNYWIALDGAPQIEVKSFKNNSYMVSLRNQGYEKKYLVLVETNLNSDYLLPFFEPSITSDEVYEKLRMADNLFIKQNYINDLTSITKVEHHNTHLGSLKLITVCLATDFMSYSTFCSANESPFYIKDITETKKSEKKLSSKPLSDFLTKKNNGLYKWNVNILTKNNKYKMLDVYISNIEKINFLRSSQSSITIDTTDKLTINDKCLEGNKSYIIKFQLLDRSSNRGEEYFMQKSITDKLPNKEDAMLNDIKNYIR